MAKNKQSENVFFLYLFLSFFHILHLYLFFSFFFGNLIFFFILKQKLSPNLSQPPPSSSSISPRSLPPPMKLFQQPSPTSAAPPSYSSPPPYSLPPPSNSVSTIITTKSVSNTLFIYPFIKASSFKDADWWKRWRQIGKKRARRWSTWLMAWLNITTTTIAISPIRSSPPRTTNIGLYRLPSSMCWFLISSIF